MEQGECKELSQTTEIIIKSAIITKNYNLIDGTWFWNNCIHKIIKYKIMLERLIFTHDQPCDFLIDSLHIVDNKITKIGNIYCRLCHTKGKINTLGTLQSCKLSCPNYDQIHVLVNNVYLTMNTGYVSVSNCYYKAPSEILYLDASIINNSQYTMQIQENVKN